MSETSTTKRDGGGGASSDDATRGGFALRVVLGLALFFFVALAIVWAMLGHGDVGGRDAAFREGKEVDARAGAELCVREALKRRAACHTSDGDCPHRAEAFASGCGASGKGLEPICSTVPELEKISDMRERERRLEKWRVERLRAFGARDEGSREILSSVVTACLARSE